MGGEGSREGQRCRWAAWKRVRESAPAGRLHALHAGTHALTAVAGLSTRSRRRRSMGVATTTPSQGTALSEASRSATCSGSAQRKAEEEGRCGSRKCNGRDTRHPVLCLELVCAEQVTRRSALVRQGVGLCDPDDGPPAHPPHTCCGK